MALGGLELAIAACRDREAGARQGALGQIGDALEAAVALLAQGDGAVRPTLDLVQRCLALAATEPG